MNDSYYRLVQLHVADIARRRRKQLGLTQEDAAQRMGIATRHLQKLEAGELNVTLQTLVRVAQALEMGVGDLFYGFQGAED